MKILSVRFSPQNVLKLCIFFTGVAGIVSEYVLSTLASYLLGNTVIQWTLTISFMLFAMGVGSRLTRSIEKHLAATFVIIEFVLSFLIAAAVPVSYLFAAWPEILPLVIYSFSAVIGLLIGMELPLTARINSRYESLELNLSSILEKDYWGALLGGIFFALVGLPVLGLTYTPFVLAFLNFLVAVIFRHHFREEMPSRWWGGLSLGLFSAFVFILVIAKPVVLWSEQKRYLDQIIYEEQSRYQKIVLTRWHSDIWLYLDGQEQFSSYDEVRYHEPLVHPSMLAAASPRQVLILGGGDGLAVREVLKYPSVEKITLVELDPAVTRLASRQPFLLSLNERSLLDPRVEIVHDDGYHYLQRSDQMWDVILADFPDPRSAALERLYTAEFYKLCRRHLSRGGVVTTQATSPYFSRRAFWCIYKTMEAAGLTPLAWHNHVPTMGEWGWVMGLTEPRTIDAEQYAEHLRHKADSLLPATRFLTPTVMKALFVFSPQDRVDPAQLRIHSEFQPVLRAYYEKGEWALF